MEGSRRDGIPSFAAALRGGYHSTAHTVRQVQTLGSDDWDARLAAGIIADVRLRMFDHVQSLPASYFARTKRGEILSRFSIDLSAFEGAIKTVANSAALPFLFPVALALLLLLLLCLVALYLLPQRPQLPVLIVDLPLLLSYLFVFRGMSSSEVGCLLFVPCYCGLRPLRLLLVVRDLAVQNGLLFFVPLFYCGLDC